MYSYEEIYEKLNILDDILRLKNIKIPPLYILGGSALILYNSIDRATEDIDLLEIEISATKGIYLNLLNPKDILDLYYTTIPNSYKVRCKKLNKLKHIDVYLLSKEDIVLSKIGRYNKKDIEDINNINYDYNLVIDLAKEVINRKDLSELVKSKFVENLQLFQRTKTNTTNYFGG